MQIKIVPRWAMALTVGAFWIAGSRFVSAGPTTATSAPAAGEVQAGLEAQLDRHVPELRFNNNKFVDVVDFLHDVMGVNIFVDWQSLADAGVTRESPVNYSAHDAPLRQVLDEILKGLKPTQPISFHTMGNTIAISTGSGMEALKKAQGALWQKADDPKLQAVLDKPLPELRLHANSLGDVFDFLRDAAGVNLYVDWRSLAVAGVTHDSPVTYNVHDLPFKQCLREIMYGLAPTKPISFRPMENVLVISTDDGMAMLKKARAAEPQTIEDAELRGKIDKHLPDLRFRDNSLSDAIDFLRDITGADIYVDWKSLKEAGISKDAPVNVRLRDLSLRDTLDLIFNEVSTDKAAVVFSTHDEVITISAVATKKTP